MTYKLEFYESALKEWEKIDSSIKEQLKKKIAERLKNPKIKSARLRGMAHCYKIKLRGSGYRLVYKILDQEKVLLVVAVGKRDRSIVYELAKDRISSH